MKRTSTTTKKGKRAMFGAAHVMPNPARLERPTIALSEVRTDGGTQPRERLDEETLKDYASRMRVDDATGFVVDPEHQKWPEIVVFYDGEEDWLADGFHRLTAAKSALIESFQVRREEGTRRDAVLYSLGVNATHGKRRTHVDKRRAIARALRDEEWRLWTDARISKLCKVSPPMVKRVRAELEQEHEIPFEPILYAADGREFERVPTLTPPAPKHPLIHDTHHAPASPLFEREELTFSDLEGIESSSLSTLIAYPVSARDWEALAEHVHRVLHKDTGRLIAQLPSSHDRALFAGPALVEDAGHFRSRQLVHVRAHDKHYAIWAMDKLPAFGVTVTSARALLQGGESGGVELVGTILDDWS